MTDERRPTITDAGVPVARDEYSSSSGAKQDETDPKADQQSNPARSSMQDEA